MRSQGASNTHFHQLYLIENSTTGYIIQLHVGGGVSCHFLLTQHEIMAMHKLPLWFIKFFWEYTHWENDHISDKLNSYKRGNRGYVQWCKTQLLLQVFAFCPFYNVFLCTCLCVTMCICISVLKHIVLFLL